MEEAFDAMCAACNAIMFVPLLEADVAGYAYYAILTKLGGDASRAFRDLGPVALAAGLIPMADPDHIAGRWVYSSRASHSGNATRERHGGQRDG